MKAKRSFTLDKLTSEYEPLLHCEYFITASEGYIIQAKFNQFHLMPCEEPNNATHIDSTASDTSCSCDYLNIRDGAGPLAETLGKYCCSWKSRFKPKKLSFFLVLDQAHSVDIQTHRI